MNVRRHLFLRIQFDPLGHRAHILPMAIKRIPRPRDPLALAKLIGDIATGQVVDAVDDGKDATLVDAGKRGGVKGGAQRALNLTPEQRAEAARLAATARWRRS